MATTYSQPQNEIREENDFHLFTGSIMDPFKNGPTGLFATALVSLGKSGRFSLGVVPKPTAILQTGQFPFTQSVSSQWPRFNQLRDGQKLPKNRLWRICINSNCENQNDWLDYWSGRKKIKKKKNSTKIKITGSIIGPAMAGPTGPFATALIYYKLG